MLKTTRFSPYISNNSFRRGNRPILVKPPRAGLLETAGILSTSIIVHELGHFAFAKSLGITVHDFTVGAGPLLLQVRGGDNVIYTLRAVPFGGAVTLGQDMQSASPLKKLAIALGGIASNIIFVYALCVASGVTIGSLEARDGIVVENINASSPAQKSGMMEGDIITDVSGIPLDMTPESYGLFMETLVSGGEMTIERGETVSTIQFEPGPYGNAGATFHPNFDIVRPSSPIDALSIGRKDFLAMQKFMMASCISFFTGHSTAGSPLSLIGSMNPSDARSTLQFFEMIGMNLALFNILPIPPLDGFYIVLSSLELFGIHFSDEDRSKAVEWGSGGFFLLMLFLVARDVFSMLFLS